MKIVFADYVVGSDEHGTNSFECAAWYEEIELTPGEYPIEGEIDKEGKIKDNVWFNIPGTIKSDYFQSLWCGNRIGQPYDINQNKGKEATWRGGLYVHGLARRIVNGKESTIRLRPGFEARKIDFEYNGEQLSTYGIFKI